MDSKRPFRVGACVIAIALISACTPDGTAVTSPTPYDRLLLLPVGATTFFTQPGEGISEPMAVKLAHLSNLKGVANASIMVARAGPDGERSDSTTVTDAEGIARLPSVKVGSQSGEYTIVATADSKLVVKFTAVVRSRIAAIYDLTSTDGKPVPAGLPLSHYVLFEDASFAWYSDLWGPLHALPGAYTRPDASTISFFIDPAVASQFYRDRNLLFATAQVAGSVMTVAYEDTSDFAVEAYVLHR